jgi:hypothetical protein
MLSSDWERCPNSPPPRGAVPPAFSTQENSIQTRESLLGRQRGVGSPFAWYEWPFEAERTTTSEIRAALG